MKTPLLEYLQRIPNGSYLSAISPSESRLLSKLKVFCDLAKSLADLSYCKRSKVGCVIITPTLSEVLAVGYNGPPAGLDNDGCRGSIGSCGCIHAEANALVKLRDLRPVILITTLSPCEHCAGLLVNSRQVFQVICMEDYRDKKGLEILSIAGVEWRYLAQEDP